MDTSIEENSTEFIKNILVDCKVLREKNGNAVHKKTLSQINRHHLMNKTSWYHNERERSLDKTSTLLDF